MTLFLQDRGWTLDLVERPARQKTEPHAAHQAMPVDGESDEKVRGVAA